MNFDDLPDKQQKFIDAYLDLGSRDEAYRKSGYSIQGRGWKANARAMFLKLEEVIEERVESRIGEGALMALSVVKDLMMNASSEAIRLKAAQDYLQRGGRDRIKEIKHVHTKEQELTDKELDAEIATLNGKMIVDSSTKLQ